MTHYTRSKRTTAGFVPRTTIPRVDQFTQMQKIKLSVHTPQPREVTQRVHRALEAVLHMELSLSLARGILTSLDANVSIPFTIDLDWSGRNVTIDISSEDSQAILTFFTSYPNLSVGPGYLIIGERSGPCVIINIRGFVSKTDTHGKGGAK